MQMVYKIEGKKLVLFFYIIKNHLFIAYPLHIYIYNDAKI